MKAHIGWTRLRDSYSVWLFRDTLDGQRLVVQHVGPDKWKNVEIREGEALPPPTLMLPADTLRAIRNYAGNLPVENVDHLHDAVKVRDRLLTLVEKLAS